MSLPEEWRPVVGYEGIYEVSSLGRVRSIDRTVMRSNGVPQRLRGQLLSLWTAPTGYLIATLRKPREHAIHSVHALVLEAFVGPRPSESHVCRHLNGDPADNRPSNLAWGSTSDNTNDMVTHGTHNNARKTHCKRGHELTPENVYIKPTPTGIARECHPCRRMRNAQNREAKRAQRR